MLDENANFGRHPTAGRPHCEDWHRSLKGSQKTDDGILNRCGWASLNISGWPRRQHWLFAAELREGSKDPCGNDTLRVLSRAKAPRLYRAALDKNDRSKAVEFLRRFRRAIARKVSSVLAKYCYSQIQ
jgi:hypothetical protein